MELATHLEERESEPKSPARQILESMRDLWKTTCRGEMYFSLPIANMEDLNGNSLIVLLDFGVPVTVASEDYVWQQNCAPTLYGSTTPFWQKLNARFRITELSPKKSAQDSEFELSGPKLKIEFK